MSVTRVTRGVCETGPTACHPQHTVRQVTNQSRNVWMTGSRIRRTGPSRKTGGGRDTARPGGPDRPDGGRSAAVAWVLPGIVAVRGPSPPAVRPRATSAGPAALRPPRRRPGRSVPGLPRHTVRLRGLEIGADRAGGALDRRRKPRDEAAGVDHRRRGAGTAAGGRGVPCGAGGGRGRGP